MKKKILVLLVCLYAGLGTRAEAVPIAVVLEVIKAGVKKAIQAIDLKVQRLQNETIWLQHAQKVLENKLSETRLGEISDWGERQRTQYETVFGELRRVKGVLASYRRVREVAELQEQLLGEYRAAWGKLSVSPLFTPSEKQAMAQGYLSLLEESLLNLGHLKAAMTPLRYEMSDAERLRVLHSVERRMGENLATLRSWNGRNHRLLYSRQSDARGLIAKNHGMD